MPAVLITGMHRSGTSALARVVGALGVDSGDPSQLMGAAPSNPYGHFEFLPVVQLNDELLASLESHWSGVVFDPASLDALAAGEIGDRARSLIADSFTANEPFFLKDPRFCVLLPFWRAVLDDPVLVLAFRHPLEVAGSLARRDGMPEAYAVRLWRDYYLRLLEGSAGMPALRVGFEDLVGSPSDVVLDLASFFEGHFTGWTPASAGAADMVDPQARTEAVASAKTLDTDVATAWALLSDPGSARSEVLGAFGSAAGAADPQLAFRARAQVALELDAAKDAAREAEELKRDVVDLERHASEVTSSLTKLKEHHDARERQWAAELSSLGRHRDSLLDQLAGAEADRRTLRAYETSRAGAIVRAYWRAADAAKRAIPGRDADSSSFRPVRFESAEEPLVSIVIPVHGQLSHTVACLESIRDNTEVPFEVIVVEDVSPDGTREFLHQCEGLILVENVENLGYLRSTNAGAAKARAPYLCLLNNDTTVTQGWLSTLVDLVASAPDVGAAGSKLVYPDGTLQEAGGIIWSDGTGWNWGRGGDPHAYEVNAVREVDYCSAACLLVRRECFEALGGYDERYVPAYYEDADLAFGLRANGYRVMYQPASVVVHHEGVSHGTDESSGLKAYQVENRHKFTEKWSEELTKQGFAGTDPRLWSWRGAGPRVLVFDHDIPAPDRDAGSVRIDSILEILADWGFKVTFAPHNRHRFEPYVTQLQARGIEVVHGPERWEALIGPLAPDLGFVWVSRPMVGAELMPLVRQLAPHVPILYDMVDFHGLRLERENELAGGEVEADAGYAEIIAALELSLVRSADVTVAITEEDAAAVKAREPEAAVAVVPMVQRADTSLSPVGDRKRVVFVGSWQHIPNRDAIEWLVEEIMPLVWEKLPEVELDLVGSDLPEDLGSTFDRRVRRVGWVPDLGPSFDAARLSVAPLRFGAGMKGKVGDSLLRGVPVVTTPVGAEGFGDAKQAMHIADDATGLAEGIVDLFVDEADWTRRSELGKAAAVDVVGFGSARRSLEALLAMVGVSRPSI